MLTRTEELLLLAVWKLQDDAYGLAVRRHMSRLLGRTLSIGGVYVPLERLAGKGLLETWERAPTARRGGRRRRHYRLTPRGLAALTAVKRLHDQAWAGLPDLAFE